MTGPDDDVPPDADTPGPDFDDPAPDGGLSPHEHTHERLDVRVGRVEALVERIASDQVRQPRSRGVFLCSTCGTSEEREIVPSATSFAEVLYAIREEVRMTFDYDKPARTAPPVAQPGIERALCAAALAGLAHKSFAQLHARHFHSVLLGRLWEIARSMQLPPVRLAVHKAMQPGAIAAASAAYSEAITARAESVAAGMEAAGYGRAGHLVPAILGLLSPHQAVTVAPMHVDAVLECAWRRQMIYDLRFVVAELQTSVGDEIDRPFPMNEEHVRMALLKALADLDAGPAGEIVERELERQARGDASPAAKDRARLYGWQRDLVYRAAGITGWLKRGIGHPTVATTRDRVAALLDRLDEARAQLVDLLAHLDAGLPR